MKYVTKNSSLSRAVLLRLFGLILCLLMILFWQQNLFGNLAYGAEEAAADYSQGTKRVFDQAGLFDQEERRKLEEKAALLREEMKSEVVVVTIDTANGRSSRQVADEFYFSHGFEQTFHENGILMLIDMDNRELYLGTYGSMIRVLTDQRIEQVLDQAYEAASRGQYAEAALAGIEKSGEFFKKGIQSNQYIYNVETGEISRYRSIRWYEALFAFIVSAGTAAAVCLNVARQYSMKEADKRSGDSLAYRTDCRFLFHNPPDQLVNTFVTHIVIPRQSNGGGHSGSGSSGRSSTHSFGGHQAGGGGRKF